MRSRQGSSTFSGTFATPGKIVGAPVKGVGFVGGNVIKGASFLGRGIMSKIRGDDSSDDEKEEQKETPSAILVDGEAPPSVSATPKSELNHSRSRSGASHYGDRLSLIGKPESGTANISVLSAIGYPASANVRVYVRSVGGKSHKDLLKTKAIKSSSGAIQFDESTRIHHTTADAQYMIKVVDHSTFGSDTTLGEAPFFVDDQGSIAGQEKKVAVGSGTIAIRSSFTSSGDNLRPETAYSNAGDNASEITDSPDSKKPRRSFLSKRNVSGA
ncbi:hypothetical protein BDV18DRAFT_147991 [Aspergillus unguis]